jgi:hypothetical protein
MYNNPKIEQMIGKTFVSVTATNDSLRFKQEDGTGFLFQHFQDCCESVEIEDIIGDLSDLENSPILQAKEVSNEDTPPKTKNEESYTWTFYNFATAKGYVTVRWYGSSNGYYSEGVNLSTF